MLFIHILIVIYRINFYKDMILSHSVIALFIYNQNSKNSYYLELKEFKQLIYSARIRYNYLMEVKINIPNIKYYLGFGILNRVKACVLHYQCSILIINIILKASQEKNLTKYLNIYLLDRTSLILKIFELGAHTYYGKLKVKLAQLTYLSSRLVRKWVHLERQKGGIRNILGPGEKQIELDRRIIKKQIKSINVKLKKIILQREKSIKLRNKFHIPMISLVGYTNSGKSTLFNVLTNSHLDINNTFFTTLDTYNKKIIFPHVKDLILLSDTVGFIHNLPENIWSAFSSTLDEIRYSFLILHVIDVSNIYLNYYINIVEKTLRKINIDYNIPVIQIMNKIDKINGLTKNIEYKYNSYLPYRIWISAKYKIGIDLICKIFQDYYNSTKEKYYFILNRFNASLIRNYIYSQNFIFKEHYIHEEKYIFVVFINQLDLLRLYKRYPFLKFSI